MNNEQKASYKRLLALAVETLGSNDEAVKWLNSPCLPLGGKRPIDLISLEDESSKVEDILGRIRHGIFS